MEKYGVNKSELQEELRNEEANLMREMQSSLHDTEKTASDRATIEQKLQGVRAKISELDLGRRETEGL